MSCNESVPHKNTMKYLSLLLVAFSTSLALAQQQTLSVSVDFPGGSAVVREIDQNARLVKIDPTQHVDRGWICWWYCKISGIRPGETITLDVGEGVWATPDQATFSLDQRAWRHTAPGKRNGKRIVFRQQIDASEAWFAWGPPFVPSDAKALVEEAAAACPAAKAFELCRTREDRPVPALRVSEARQADRLGVWVQARQHAWESGSSWVCRGFVEWLVSNDPRARALRGTAEVVVVPIMDIDNVAIGAGGKNERPRDHNRDWSDRPHHKSVAAAQQEILRMNKAEQFDLFIDLHNPGAGDKTPFFFIPPPELLTPLGQRNIQEFLAAGKEEMTGPLKYEGRTLVSGANYDKDWRQISKNWVAEHTRDHVVAVTLETAWNTPFSTADNYRKLGRELGLAIQRYLQTARRRAK